MLYLIYFLGLILVIGEIVMEHGCSVDNDQTADELKQETQIWVDILLIDSFKELRYFNRFRNSVLKYESKYLFI